WYLGAIYRTAAPLTYEICAQEIPGTITPIVTNRLYTTNQIGGEEGQDYNGTISNHAALDYFTLPHDMGGDCGLSLSTNTMTPLFGTPTDAMYQSVNAGLAPDVIQVSAFSLVNPLTPGTWFLAVVNKDPLPATYDLAVWEYTTNFPYITLTNGIAYGD